MINKPFVSLFIRVWLVISIVLIPWHVFSVSKETFQQFVITNQSGFPKFNAIVKISLPAEWKDQPCVVLSEADKALKLPFIRHSYDTEEVLFVQTSLLPFEEKKIIVKKAENVSKSQDQLVTPHAPGTEFLLVNYKEAILISTEEENRIQFFSNEGKQFLPESSPLVLGEGKSYTLRTNSPQLISIKSEKPLFVYASSINYQKDHTNIEAGDSDTTTLFTNSCFIYAYKHVWISSYEETEVKLFDENGRNVLTKRLPAQSGYFIDDLSPGPYKMISDQPVTIQFGYLDDENFSFIHGGGNQIHGYAFGDLLIQSIYPDTNIEIEWEKKGKQKFQLKEAFQFEMVKPIEAFLPKKPEFIFFTLQSNHPVRVCSFSSGNNFGGEFIPGNTLLYKDRQFEIITTKVSKEFSKEQRNLIELIGLIRDTNVVISGSVEKKITLQQNTHFDVPSSTPLDKISVDSSAEMMLCQLHNFTNKGLFYVIPPLEDNTITVIASETLGEGIFQDDSDHKQGIINFYRIKEFFRNMVHVPYLPLTLFFLGLIGIVIVVLLLLMNKMGPHPKENKAAIKTPSLPEKPPSETIPSKEKEKTEPVVPNSIAQEEKPAFKFKIPDLKEANQAIVYPTLRKADEIPRFIQTPAEKKESEPKESLVISDQRPSTPIPQEKPIQNFSASSASHIQSNVVLDPGSANRLYYEQQLLHFQNAYIVSSSIKKLPQEVHQNLHRIDLNLQDQTRIANLLRSLPIMEESAKAIALCKKMKIAYYISSYPLPQKILDIRIIPVGEWKQFLLK